MSHHFIHSDCHFRRIMEIYGRRGNFIRASFESFTRWANTCEIELYIYSRLSRLTTSDAVGTYEERKNEKRLVNRIGSPVLRQYRREFVGKQKLEVALSLFSVYARFPTVLGCLPVARDASKEMYTPLSTVDIRACRLFAEDNNDKTNVARKDTGILLHTSYTHEFDLGPPARTRKYGIINDATVSYWRFHQNKFILNISVNAGDLKAPSACSMPLQTSTRTRESIVNEMSALGKKEKQVFNDLFDNTLSMCSCPRTYVS